MTTSLDAWGLNWKMEVARRMMTAVVQQETSTDSPASKPQVPPSVLLIGKKRTLDYVAPALFRMNNIGELVIKATGSLSIVTAVDVAEIVKRDLDHIATQSITLGTDELKVATGELKRMSCIEIRLIKVCPITVAQPSVDVHVSVEEIVTSPDIEIPIERAAPAVAEVPVVVKREKEKKPRSKRKSSSTTKKKKKSNRKKKKSTT